MILEHAVLPVRRGQETAFEAALAEALPIIRGFAGCRRATVRRSIETPNQYLLLVEWDTLEAHTDGFRGSAEYQRWRTLLHRFYDPFPVVEHFSEVGD